MANIVEIASMMIGLGLLALVIIVLGIKLRDSIVLYVPFIVTRKEAIAVAIKEMDLKKGDIVYDLGCGDGSVLIAAIKQIPGIRGVGIEKGIIPFLLAKIKTRGMNIDIRYQDIFATNIGEATHIYCYLHSSLAERLEKKISTECRKGTSVVTSDYVLPTMQMDKKVDIAHGKETLSKTVYVYTV